MRRASCTVIAAAAALVAASTLTLGKASACGGEGPPIVPEWSLHGAPDRATRLVGRVLDLDGTPVAGARVGVETGFDDLHVATDAAGRFDVALPTTSPVARCVVAADGRAVALGTWTAVAQGRVTDVGEIRLARPATIRGRVADADDRPAAWSWIEIDGTDVFGAAWESVARLGGVGTVDCDPATGAFEIASLPAGRFTLTGKSVTADVSWVDATAPSDGVRLAATPFPDGPRLDVDATLGPPDERAPDEDADAVVERSGSIVRGERVSDGGCMSPSWVRFRTTPPCTLLFPGSRAHRRVEVAIDSVPHRPIRMELAPLPIGPGDYGFTGIVEGDGKPAQRRCVVEATREPGRGEEDVAPWPVATTRTLPDGTFTFAGLRRGGTYRVRAWVETARDAPDDTESAPDVPQSARADAESARADAEFAPSPRVRVGKELVRVALARCVERRIDVAVPSAPESVPDFRVECVATQRRRGETPALVPDVVVAGDVAGAGVTLRGLDPARPFSAVIRVRANGVWTRRLVAEGAAIGAPLVVTAPTGRRIAGRVVRDGRPVPGARVEFRTDSGPPGDAVVTDLDGRFALDGFDGGIACSVTAWSGTSGHGRATLDAHFSAAAAGSVEIALQPVARR